MTPHIDQIARDALVSGCLPVIEQRSNGLTDFSVLGLQVALEGEFQALD